MFTGLVEEMGTVRGIRQQSRSLHIHIAAGAVLADLKLGDSVAVNGCCLTVVQLGSDGFTADVMPETFQKTNLGQLRNGDRVNLERTLTLETRLGGHLVSGHIDGVGTVRTMQRDEIAVKVTIAAPPEVLRYTVPKGSVAIDGISLTVVDVDDTAFSVGIIPHTFQVTTMGGRRPGDQVNLEADLIGKYVEKFVAARFGAAAGGRLTEGFLEANGFK